MASDPLSADSILSHMADALPTHKKEDTDSDLSSSYEAIALFCHACMVAVGFRILAFGENQKNEEELAQLAPRLPSRWNASFGSHSFLYAHSQSSMQYVVKVDRMGTKAEIRGIGLGDERIARFEIVARDYISPSALPLRITMTEDGEEDRSNLKSKLQQIFISPPRITDLASLFKSTIIQKLVPNIYKEGYEESAASAARDERESELQQRRNPPPNPLRDDRLPAPARPLSYDDPVFAPPRLIPAGDFPPPGFDDEYDLNRPLGVGGLRLPGGRSPFNIGHDDLNPPGLGPNDPLRGSFVGGGGLPRPGGGGGMHPTFDDPLFGGQGGAYPLHPSAPPGARYDPLGPGDGAPRGSGGGGRFPGAGPGGRPHNPFGGFGGGDFL